MRAELTRTYTRNFRGKQTTDATIPVAVVRTVVQALSNVFLLALTRCILDYRPFQATQLCGRR